MATARASRRPDCEPCASSRSRSARYSSISDLRCATSASFSVAVSSFLVIRTSLRQRGLLGIDDAGEPGPQVRLLGCAQLSELLVESVGDRQLHGRPLPIELAKVMP